MRGGQPSYCRSDLTPCDLQTKSLGLNDRDGSRKTCIKDEKDNRDGPRTTDADCVLYAPPLADVDEMCRIFESGKNVVIPTGFSFVKAPTLASRLAA